MNQMDNDTKQALTVGLPGVLLLLLVLLLAGILTKGPSTESRLDSLIKIWKDMGTTVKLEEDLSVGANNWDKDRASIIFSITQDKPPYMTRTWLNPVTDKTEEVRIKYVGIVTYDNCHSCWKINFYKDDLTYVCDASFGDYMYLIKHGHTYQEKTRKKVKGMLGR